ncbi:NB-ARC domain-containing protein [Saccharothrix carnea]|uniref:NB-ARC domain-containing protein n=1 Tax=Saccharothrix carnea TaxID=1280637 RepID=A0A2P8I4E1_SACCR|nr:tetratricopeptide repeat protein [Saccharothrix carnea]PSL53304.1 NB-ARC domain-containing protein [Saccharothrix carnea]
MEESESDTRSPDPLSVINDVDAREVGTIVQVGTVYGGLNITSVTPPERLVPRQLPAAPPQFAGRLPQLERLDEVLGGAAVFISAIGGAGGIGKTWLALHWAHRRADSFPDGQLFVDLRGFSPEGDHVAPEPVIRGFLEALGVEPQHVPVGLASQAALYRSLVADRKMLVLLDNAADAEQVEPLLPGGRACTVVVTSRKVLTRLVTRHGARHLPLDVLGDEEARALLLGRLNPSQTDAVAVHDIVRLCGGLPLALGIVAGRAAARPATPLAKFAEELRELGLGALDDDDPMTSLPAVLSWSYAALTPDQRVAFGLLGIAPGADISRHAAASLLNRSSHDTATILRQLEEASLLTCDARHRYSMHDLVREYATTTAQHIPDQDRAAALTRVVDFYLHTAHTATLLISPHDDPLALDPPAPGTHPQPLTDAEAAFSWLDTERHHLLASQHTATAHHRYDIVWHLAWTLNTFHYRQGHHYDDLAAWQAAADITDHLSDPAIRTRVHRHLGSAFAALGRHEQAIANLDHSLTIAERHDDRTQQAHTHYDLSGAWERMGDPARALVHARLALELYRGIGQPVWEADALSAVGWFAARLGDHDTADAHCREALDRHRANGNVEGEAGTLDSLGYIAHRTNRHDHAIDLYQQALDLCRAIDYPTGTADILEHLGHPLIALGRDPEARTAWAEALDLLDRQGRADDATRVRRQIEALDRATADQ